MLGLKRVRCCAELRFGNNELGSSTSVTIPTQPQGVCNRTLMGTSMSWPMYGQCDQTEAEPNASRNASRDAYILLLELALGELKCLQNTLFGDPLSRAQGSHFPASPDLFLD